MALSLRPLPLKTANQIVRDWHRHNRPTNGGLFAIGVESDGEIVGCAIVARPVSATYSCNPYLAEVTRVCVLPSAPRNANSMLYGACWRAWRAMGGRRLITYTLTNESGASLRGAGWKVVAEVAPGSWNRPNAGRVREYQNVYGQQKLRWEREEVSHE